MLQQLIQQKKGLRREGLVENLLVQITGTDSHLYLLDQHLQLLSRGLILRVTLRLVERSRLLRRWLLRRRLLHQHLLNQCRTYVGETRIGIIHVDKTRLVVETRTTLKATNRDAQNKVTTDTAS